MPDDRTFEERKREIETLVAEQEQASAAYCAWLQQWKDKRKGFRCKRGQAT